MAFRENKVTIIMYHYVRDLRYSRYPEIKGLDIKNFQEQVMYLKKHYEIISMDMLIDAIENKSLLPSKSVLLTFDDGYIDHFRYVFPVLSKLGIQGCFYPPVKAITKRTVLNVNKVHFILAAEKNKFKIIGEIKNELSKYREQYNLKSDSYYFDKLAHPNRFDSPEVIFIKRLLQVELQEELRNKILKTLFGKIVGVNEEIFSRELYMDEEQLQCMNKCGMHIGCHGYNHDWLASLTYDKQKDEIEKSLKFLEQIGTDLNNWTMCFPYGSYNDASVEILSKLNCKIALTTQVSIANLSSDNVFALPRIDTNDIPKQRDAPKNDWYFKG